MKNLAIILGLLAIMFANVESEKCSSILQMDNFNPNLPTAGILEESQVMGNISFCRRFSNKDSCCTEEAFN